MWNHSSVWSAIDALAARHGLSPSGLAKKAGLDATAFNVSKRHGGDGRPRWPSTKSIAKILVATGEPLQSFVDLSGRRKRAPSWGANGRAPLSGSFRPVPLVGLAQAGPGGFFDDGGFPAGQGWDQVTAPGLSDEEAYALEVTGDSMLPLYRNGDIIIVSPVAQIRRGDRIVVKTANGEVMAKILERQSAAEMELASLNPEHANRVLPAGDVDWVARILWASQ